MSLQELLKRLQVDENSGHLEKLELSEVDPNAHVVEEKSQKKSHKRKHDENSNDAPNKRNKRDKPKGACWHCVKT